MEDEMSEQKNNHMVIVLLCHFFTFVFAKNFTNFLIKRISQVKAEWRDDRNKIITRENVWIESDHIEHGVNNKNSIHHLVFMLKQIRWFLIARKLQKTVNNSKINVRFMEAIFSEKVANSVDRF